jgi:Carboxypeptidase regulatory-like domain
VVAGAAITITQPATGTVRAVQTGAAGTYEVRYLLPGEWLVEVRLAGFRSQKSAPFEIQVGQVARMDFTLQVGEVTEQVEVTAQGVLLETQNGVLAARGSSQFFQAAVQLRIGRIKVTNSDTLCHKVASG